MTTEKHLYLALESHRISSEDSKLFKLACEIIHDYIIERATEFDTEEELLEKSVNLVIDHALNAMISDGFLEEHLDENGRAILKPTEAGEKLADG